VVFSKVKDLLVDTRIIFLVILSILFVSLFVLFVYLVYQSVSLEYLPIYSDEFGYYLDAKAFQLCGRFGAAMTVNEYYSVIGHSSFYGFMYALFYGSFFKLFSLLGITPSIMLVNMFLVMCLFIFLAFINIRMEKKFLIGIVLLSNYVFILYLSSSMTELYHLVFGIVAAYFLYRLYETKEKRYLYMFILLVLFLSLSRPAWIFTFFGLFPLSASLKDFFKYLVILFLGLLYVVLIEKYFYAPYPFSFMHLAIVYLQEHTVVETVKMLYEHFLSNVDNYFISVKYGSTIFVYYYKYLYVIVLVYAAYSSFRHKSKSVFAGMIIAAVFFLSVMGIYDAYDWREVRVLATPFMLLVTLLILNKKYFPIILIILFQLFYLGDILRHKQVDDGARVAMHSQIKESQNLLKHFLEFEKYVDEYKKKEIFILLDQNLFQSHDSAMMYQLPLTVKGKCIRYSLIMDSSYDVAHSKSDLFISRKSAKIDNMELAGKNKNFLFFKRVH